MGAGGAGAGGEWYRSQTDEGWGEYTAGVSILFRFIPQVFTLYESRILTNMLYFLEDSSSNTLGN